MTTSARGWRGERSRRAERTSVTSTAGGQDGRAQLLLFKIVMKTWQIFCSRFKTPLVRGVPNTQLDQFHKIEALISSDLDHWLCNLYFQVCLCGILRPSLLFFPKRSLSLLVGFGSACKGVCYTHRSCLLLDPKVVLSHFVSHPMHQMLFI